MSTSWSSWTTPIAPRTRTSTTPVMSAAGASPERRPAPIRATSASQSCPSNRSTEAVATEAASGLPMNVGPCASTGTSPLEMPSATRVVHSVAAIVR